MLDGKKRILALAKELNCNKAKKLCDWNGYAVYEPVSASGVSLTGLPLVILSSKTETRISTPKEAFAITDYMESAGLLDENGEPLEEQ